MRSWALAGIIFSLLLGMSPAHASVAVPSASGSRTGDGRILFTLGNAAGVDGFNVYRNGRYYTTVHPPAGSNRFHVDGAGGSYCIVAFRARGDRNEYSSCSRTITVAAGPPAPPGRVRAAVHSPGVADIIWTPSRDHVAIAGYEVRRNGERIAFHKGRSQFESGLATVRAHDYEITAIDRAGRRSQPARYRLPPSGGRRGSVPTATVREDTRGSAAVSGASSNPVAVPTGSGLSISAGVDRPQLLEGDSRSLRVPIRVNRARASGTVQLALSGYTAADERMISHRFEPTHLGYGRTDATLVMKLDVAMAPLRRHARQFNVEAYDGSSRVQSRLVVDVRPTEADDVYLLIGQSNMVGYSEQGAKDSTTGGGDALHSRIRQLNARENSRRVFQSAADFTSDAVNVRGPAYTRAEDPLHTPKRIDSEPKSSRFIGLGLSFAKSALSRANNDIYLVPAAWGATGFCANFMGELAWNASPNAGPGLGGTLLLDRALARLDKTLRDTGGVLRGILWHQGGADASDARCADTYAANLVRMVERLRREAAVDPRGPLARGNRAAVPFIVATMSKGADSRGSYARFSPRKQRIDSVHRAVADLMPYADFIDNDDLVPPAYPCGQSSCVHFGADALREQGKRFDQALRRIIARHP